MTVQQYHNPCDRAACFWRQDFLTASEKYFQNTFLICSFSYILAVRNVYDTLRFDEISWIIIST
jgi:hypothetical protein